MRHYIRLELTRHRILSALPGTRLEHPDSVTLIVPCHAPRTAAHAIRFVAVDGLRAVLLLLRIDASLRTRLCFDGR